MRRTLTLFGYSLVRADKLTIREEELKKTFRRELDKKSTEILKLTVENRSLKLFQIKQRPFIDVSVAEPSPRDSEKRKMYVASAAQFGKEILQPKLLHMISDVRAQLEKMDSAVDNSGVPITNFKSNEFDKILKGTINAFWLLFEWCTEMQGEQLEYQREVTQPELDELKELAS